MPVKLRKAQARYKSNWMCSTSGTYKKLGVTCKDKVTNAEVLARTGQKHLRDMAEERRLRFVRHVIRVAPERPANHAMDWIPADGKRKRRRPRKTWQSTFQEDVCARGVSPDEVETIVADCVRWQKLLHIVLQETGGTKC